VTLRNTLDQAQEEATALQATADDLGAQLTAAREQIATLEARDCEDQATIDALRPLVAPHCPIGFAGTPPTGIAERAHRVYLNPGEAFPALPPGVLPFVTFKGANDVRLRCDQARAFGAPLFLGFAHEPENDLTPQAFIAAWQVLGAYCPRNARTVMVLMAATYAAGNADVWYPGDDAVDVVGADGYDWAGARTDKGGDGYSKPGASHRSFAKIFEPVEAFAARHGKPIAVGEFGTPDDHDGPQRKADWLAEAGAHLRATPAYVAATYFQHSSKTGDAKCTWSLDTPEAIAAWQALLDDPYFGGL